VFPAAHLALTVQAPLLARLVARSSPYLVDFLPFSRFLSRRLYSPIAPRFTDTPFPRPFYPHRARRRGEREGGEREGERREDRERRETEARRAFGILTLLFYSPYTLSSHRYRRDLLNHLSTIREMDENRELAREIAVARRAARGRETSSATSSPKLMPDY